MGYYRHTNPSDPACYATALRRERASLEPLRVMALHHPPVLPDHLDYTNTARSTWYDPFDSGEPRQESFLDLFGDALAEARGILGKLWRALEGLEDPADLAAAVGDHALDSERQSHRARAPLCSDPFPLHEILDSYRAPTV
jgi:hypothetical protein